MTLDQLKADVISLTGANYDDYLESEMERNMEQEYIFIQHKLKSSFRIELTESIYPTVYTFTSIATDFIPTEMNLHIERVEVSTDGTNWHRVERTNKTVYNTAVDNNSCSCSNESFTNAITKNGCPANFIQTTEGIHVFPVPTDGFDVKVYVKSADTLNWNLGNSEPRLEGFAHRLLSLKASLLYRDIENTGNLEFILSEYSKWDNALNAHINEGGKVIRMSYKQDLYI
jgi:hypothetical protein